MWYSRVMTKSQVTLCSFNPCTRVRYSQVTGLCRSHHSQVRRGYPLKTLRGEPVTCNHEGCEALAATKGFCRTHYMQFWKYGTTYGEGSPESCAAINCKRPVSALGLCQRHYLSGGEHRIQGERNTDGTCGVRNCSDHAPVDLCRSHANRASQYGLSRGGFVRLMDVPGCPACGSEGVPLSVHHDHKCCDGPRSCGGCVLSPLCDACNRASGVLHDNAKTLRNLAEIAEGPHFRES